MRYLALLLSLLACQKNLPPPTVPSVPLVIAHRGASGYRPEHTLAAYELAIDMGADYIEPDLVATRDGALVARHENEISGTTDVAQRFPERKTRKQIDGKWIEGWFTEDFSLAEIKTLRARERLPELRGTRYDGLFAIPTLQEVLALARDRRRPSGPIGLYPELKHPAYFASIGLPLEERLLRILDEGGLRSRQDPVFIQSFDASCLRTLRARTALRLIQLVAEHQAGMLSTAGLRDIARYADGIGPNKRLLIPAGPDGRLLAPTDLVQRAHAQRLLVHPFAFRKDPPFLAPNYGGDAVAEMVQFFELGVDGVFSDFPDLAMAARAAARRL